MTRKRIAIFMHGGIGGGDFSQGQPVVARLVEALARNYEVLLYSQLAPNAEYKPTGFQLFTAPDFIRFSIVRWLWLIVLFVRNQLRREHQLLYAFWGYPSGVIAVFLAFIFKKPSVIHLQGGDATSIPEKRYGVFYNSFSRVLCRWAYAKTSLLIALTQFQKDQLAKQSVHRHVEIIPYGPDLTLFTFQENKLQGNTFRFLHIGNHNAIKDQHTMLRAFAKVCKHDQRCTLRIIGYDALRGALKRYCDELTISDRVEFIGSVPYHEIPHYLSEADILLHTSLYEGQGTVFSEAAACGVLLAGTRVGLLADLGDSYGLIVKVGDSEDLATKIKDVLTDTGRARSCIRKARIWAEQSNSEWTEKKIIDHLNCLLESNGKI